MYFVANKRSSIGLLEKKSCIFSDDAIALLPPHQRDTEDRGEMNNTTGV